MSTVLPPTTTRLSPGVPAFSHLDRRAWLWFSLGMALLPFTLFQNALPIAAWMAPVFLLRFARTRRARVALPLIAFAGYLASLIGLRDVFPLPLTLLFALGGLSIVVPYGLDRLLVSRLPAALRTLVFPLGVVALDFLAINDTTGTLGALAYNEALNLPLLQVVSLTGIWGLTFLMAWLAPVANALWEHDFIPGRVLASVSLFTGVLLAALLFGGMRLAFFAPSAPTVQVAALAPDRQLDDAIGAALTATPPHSLAERAVFQAQHLDPLLDELLARTRASARGGARIVVWAEAAGFLFKEHEATLVARAQTVAREEQIYLQLGLVVFLASDSTPRNENRALLIDPSGEIRWDYHKTKVVLSDGNAPGPGVVPVIDTPYGRLATVICFDADFPALVRQAGRADTDILLVPASDWASIAEFHSRAAILRAVENGAALIRPTRKGTSLAVDHQGRLLGYKADYFSADAQTLMVSVPTRGTTTLYSRIGDSVAYLAITGLFALAVLAIVRWRAAIRPQTR